MRKIKQWLYLLALLSIPLSNVQADAEKTTTSLIESILGNPDVCRASYDENGVLNVPCVDVSLGEHHTAYRAKLEVNENSTEFKLISSEEIANLPIGTSDCISKYDVNSGKLEIPCLNKDVLFLLADISENPLYFFNAIHEPRNVRESTRSSLVENTTKCNTPYANAANFFWKKFQDPIYDVRIAKLNDLFNGELESEQKAVSLIIDTISASASIKGALDLNSSELDSETNKKILSSILGTSGMVVAKNADNKLWAILFAEALDGASLVADPKSFPTYFMTKLTGIVKDYYYIWTAWSADKKLKQVSAERSAIETLLHECATTSEGRDNAVSLITQRKITKWDNLIAISNCPEEYRNSGNSAYQCLIYNGLFGKDGSFWFGSDIDIPVAADKVLTIVSKVREQAGIAGYKNPQPKTWYGNGSIIAYGSRNKTTERSFGLVEDMSKYTEELEDSKPGVFFFQWQKENNSGKNLKIYGSDGSENFLVSITYGPWDKPEEHVTYENVNLPFVLDPCKDFQYCLESEFFTIAVSLTSKKTTATIRASATNDDSTYYNSKPTKHLPVIVDGHVWTGTGSIINYSAGDIKGDGLTQDVLKFVWGDGWESPAVFFQWQVKKGKQKLEITTTSDSGTTTDERCFQTLNITYGPWNQRKYNRDARVTNGKYTITIPDTEYKSGGETWIVIKVAPEIPSTCYSKGKGVNRALIKAKAITSTN